MSPHVCKGKSTQTCNTEVAACDSQWREADAQEWQMCKGSLNHIGKVQLAASGTSVLHAAAVVQVC